MHGYGQNGPPGARARRRLDAGLLLAVLVLGTPVPSALALRCGNRIVDVGDSKFDVLAQCGKPADVERRTEEITERSADEGRERSVIVPTEEWVYNFGPNQFLAVLTFREERLVNIESRGYGFLPGAPRGVHCTNEIFTQRKKRVSALLEGVGMLEQKDKFPDQISGGQKQRVAVARALVTNPRLVLADEPTANLDHATAYLVLSLMKRLRDELKTTFVFSTHDQKIVGEAEILFTLEDGELKGREDRGGGCRG